MSSEQGYYKYPRTPHLPWSPGATADDIRVVDTKHFAGKRVIVTIKRDGECSSIYHDGKVHARSIDSGKHTSRDWLKALAATISHELPSGWRIVLENLYAEHTIHYKFLQAYAEVISFWTDQNQCLDWDATQEWCSLLNLKHVPVIYDGIYDEGLIQRLYKPFDACGDQMEGYVVRVARTFHYNQFSTSVAKYVASQFKADMESNGEGHWLEKHKFSVITNGIIYQ